MYIRGVCDVFCPGWVFIWMSVMQQGDLVFEACATLV